MTALDGWICIRTGVPEEGHNRFIYISVFGIKNIVQRKLLMISDSAWDWKGYAQYFEF